MRLMVGQALAFTAPDRLDRSLRIGDLAGVVAEIKFRQITVQVLFSAVLIDALHSSFEDRKEALDRVGMHVATNVFAM